LNGFIISPHLGQGYLCSRNIELIRRNKRI